MPETTPIYGFSYPCAGDVVDPADFATLGGQIDTALDAADADMQYALNRYNVTLIGAAQGATVNVDVTLTTPTYTAPVAGVWLVRAHVARTTTPTTVNMMRTRLLHSIAPALRYGQTANTEGNQSLFKPWAAAPFVATAGSVFSIIFQWNGTGTMNVQGFLSARLLCRIA